jgi:hypothetical protein
MRLMRFWESDRLSEEDDAERPRALRFAEKIRAKLLV